MRESDERPLTILAVCGSIAAYKAVEVLRHLQRAGRPVQVIMTASARRFIGEETFEGLTSRQVYTDMYGDGVGELHVELSRRGETLLVVAATADMLARLATGRADDLVTATALCFSGPVCVAPAMHPNMWTHPATQRNVRTLRDDGVRFLGPVQGRVASGDEGMGRMMEPADIAQSLLSAGDLFGKRIIVTAGPTVEDVDPVRFLSNRSTGRMGYSIARRALERGASVELISGPVQLEPPPGATVYPVRTALDLLARLRERCLTPSDAVIMAAAVGDFRVRQPHARKLKRGDGLHLDLVENPDIIHTIATERRGPIPRLVAFALETGSDEAIIASAREKLERKGVDLVVANRADEALETTTNRVHLIHQSGCTSLPMQSKLDVADAILDRLVSQ